MNCLMGDKGWILSISISMESCMKEDKFDRKYCCYWKRGGRKIKRSNRKLFRRRIKTNTNKELTIFNEGKFEL